MKRAMRKLLTKGDDYCGEFHVALNKHMKNKYVDFITDEHFLKCVENLHDSYLKAKTNISKKNFIPTRLIQ